VDAVVERLLFLSLRVLIDDESTAAVNWLLSSVISEGGNGED
jgi:hypothetical protein